jgi:cyclopropane fatty-acyl-phospholipid synthase-like methyltransferase
MDKIHSAVSEYYTNKLKQFGTTPAGVDWNSKQSQELRFEQLSKVLPVEADAEISVLDYGCGYGAMYEYLKQRYPNLAFVGYDISEEMINSCKQRYGESAKWTSQASELVPVDYVVASGIFNVRMNFSDSQWLSYILETLDTMNEFGQKGFSFNVLTSYSDKEYMRGDLYYADPLSLFDQCKTRYSRFVTLLHDYPLYEFTILVRK